ncbi:unnamed protein product [Echinostoma caproni]|uniref:Innexin n=1 Tax=Echinostoma caproni TaxID=27848 RepID=A0A183AQ18_9TREM|nr:unnamed protein product [Echinostoma caproni]
MFLEKIYIFLWFWHVTIAMITVLSLLIWLHRVFLIRSRMHFILSYLRPLDPNPAKFRLDWEKHDREFVDSYLGYDGLFIIRLISANCGGMLAGELVYSLWQDFRNPRPPTAEKCGGTVNREHTCGCFTMPVHENAPDWSVPPVPGDYQPVARESSFWRTMDSMPNHRSQFTRGHLSPSFSRRKYIMVKRDTTQSFHTDSQHKFLPSGLKHAPLGADPDQSTHSTATNMSTGQNFQNGQLNDDIV